MKIFNVTRLIKELNLKPLESTTEFDAIFAEHISKIGGWPQKEEALFLYKLAQEVPAGLKIVEIGSYEGKSTISLALGAGSNVQVIAVDPHTGDISEAVAGKVINTYERFVRNISNAGVSHKIKPMKTTSVEAAAGYSDGPIGLLFIDGWHSTQAVLDDIDSWLPFMHPNGVVVLDDWNDEQVRNGIKRRLSMLPKLLGAVGKEMAFTNNLAIRDSQLGQHAKQMYKRLKLLIKLSNLKNS